MVPRDKYIKFGGMKFAQNTSTQEINEFVDALPENKRQSMHQVVEELDDADLINLLNQVTTIDDETLQWQATDERGDWP
ncbi:MAG: hypothetical protein ACOWWO_13075 [Peptococcaceae bacterium]